MFVNDELKSSLPRAPMATGVHSFRAPAGAPGEASEHEYQVWFAFDKFAQRLCFDIRRWPVGPRPFACPCVASNVSTYEIDQWGLFPHS